MKRVKLISILIITSVLLTSCNIARTGSKSAHSVMTTKQTESETITEPEDTIETTIESITEPDTKEQTETEEITEPLATSQIEPPDTIEPIIPDQSYVGYWASQSTSNDIYIYEITSEYIEFNMTIYRSEGFEAVAIMKDGEIVFGDGISPYYHGPDGTKGRLMFAEGSVTFIFDEFGDVQNYVKSWGNVYTFTEKTKISDVVMEMFYSRRNERE